MIPAGISVQRASRGGIDDLSVPKGRMSMSYHVALTLTVGHRRLSVMARHARASYRSTCWRRWPGYAGRWRQCNG
jgi:hypothetical protein